MKKALQDHEAELAQELQLLKAANARKEDEMGRQVDGTTSQMACTREGIRAKQEFIRTSQSTISRLQAEVCNFYSNCFEGISACSFFV